MRCRGQDFSETREPQRVTEYGRQNEHVTLKENKYVNRIQLNWHYSTQYNSWCKIGMPLVKQSAKGYIRHTFKFGYGQINYSFRLNLPFDKFLDGLPIVNVTSRKVTQHTGSRGNNLPKIDVTNGSIYHCHFAFCNHIQSTRVGLLGVTAASIPILIPKNKCVLHKCNVHSKDPSQIATLHLIDLEPFRHNVSISLNDARLKEPEVVA